MGWTWIFSNLTFVFGHSSTGSANLTHTSSKSFPRGCHPWGFSGRNPHGGRSPGQRHRARQGSRMARVAAAGTRSDGDREWKELLALSRRPKVPASDWRNSGFGEAFLLQCLR